ncbi:MAG: hypothetical protein J4F28_09650 [Nitrosopumilaceae archaeon]|nr:hypothetical protein [Nitrosopumilaceae archaeon]
MAGKTAYCPGCGVSVGGPRDTRIIDGKAYHTECVWAASLLKKEWHD